MRRGRRAGGGRARRLPRQLTAPGRSTVRARRGWTGSVLLGLAGGLGCAASLPPFGWWPLGLLGAAMACRAVTRETGTRDTVPRALVGLAFGLGLFVPGLAFVAAFSVPGYFVLCLFEAVFYALGAALVRGRFPLAGAFVLAEWARDHWPFGGLPVASPVLGQVGGPLAPIARLGGPYALLAALWIGGAAIEALSRRAVRPAALAAGTVALLALGGAVAPSGGAPVGSLSVALVQGGGARGEDALEVPATDAFVDSLQVTLALRGRIGLVVWPENTVPLPASSTPAASSLVATLGELARRTTSTFVAGTTQPVATSRFRNELVVLAPSGRLLATVEKTHPVPFGETVPWRSIVRHLADLADVPRDMIVGDGEGAVTTPAGRLGLVISYEDFFPARARGAVRHGAVALVVATNTASYSSNQVPEEELAASRLAAIAEGRMLVQAATIGATAVIAPSGAVLDALPLGRPGALVATVGLRRGATPYAVAGDLPALALALGGLAAGALRRRRAGLSPRR